MPEWLVDQLRQVGRARDLTAAAMVEGATRRELVAVALTENEPTAVLGVFDDPPDGLAALGGLLS
jgi:hypothetical protein